MGNLEKIKKALREIIVVQIVMLLIYGVMVLLDDGDYFILETILLILIAIAPVILARFYMKSDKEETEKTKRFIITSIIWIIDNIIIAFITILLREKFATMVIRYIAIVPIVLVLICKGISYIYQKIKA